MTATSRMPRLTRLAGRRALIVLTLGIAASASLTSCAPSDTEIVAPPFALTSADVVYPSGQAYPVNLIFAASADDPIWTDLTGVALPGDASVGPGEFEVIRGEGSGGYDLGNIAFDLEAPREGLSFESVGLIYTGATEPVQSPVGSWRFSLAEPQEFATEDAGQAVAAMTGCTSADFPLPPSTSSVESFETGSDDVRLEDMQFRPETETLTVSLSCDDDSDFQIISPTLAITTPDGDIRSIRLSPVAIGFQDVDDADLQRILNR